MLKKYNYESWIDPRIKVKKSLLGGKGLFVFEPVKMGEIIIIWGGIIMTWKDIEANKHEEDSRVGIGEDLYLADCAGTLNDDSFLNHSCDPNLWMEDEVRLMARRNIDIGEELTIDYAMFMADSDWDMGVYCKCGSLLCRKKITGDDWKNKDLQKRYKDHFSPFINKKIQVY